MQLHKDKERFHDAIMAASARFGFEPALIEKDYYVTLFLKRATERINGLVFKGGTSLSKCYKLIDRFSEDVDLTLDAKHFTQSNKRNSIKELIAVCDDLELILLNREKIELHTHGNFNRLEIQYPITFHSDYVKSELIVEMAFIQKSYPSEKGEASSYVGDFLREVAGSAVLAIYGLEPFCVQVQMLQRTLIDKVFALCDYYLGGNTERNSRHIYDIAKLLTRVNVFDDKLHNLVGDVRNDRKHNKTCLSAQDGVEVPNVLKSIIETGVFKNDYDKTTLKLLLHPINYDEAIKSLQAIIDSKTFLIDEIKK